MIIVAGSSSGQLADALAGRMGVELAKTEHRIFPDGEQYVRVGSNLKDEDVVLIQNSFPDTSLVELLLLQDAVRRWEPERITTVVPYFGYARQDKVFKPGEPASGIKLARTIASGTDRFLTVDVHGETILDSVDVPTANVSGMPAIGAYLEKNPPDLVLSPDEGAIGLAKQVADVLDCSFDFLEKTRLDGEHVRMTPKNIDASGKRVAIVDDIISTGGTILEAIRQLKENGADNVVAACTHGLFVGNALDRLTSVCEEVVSTDTVEGPATRPSVASEVARSLPVDI